MYFFDRFWKGMCCLGSHNWILDLIWILAPKKNEVTGAFEILKRSLFCRSQSPRLHSSHSIDSSESRPLKFEVCPPIEKLLGVHQVNNLYSNLLLAPNKYLPSKSINVCIFRRAFHHQPMVESAIMPYQEFRKLHNILMWIFQTKIQP